MYYKISFCLIFLSILGLSSCDILTGNSETDKGIPIKTSTASGVAAMEVLQNERGILILGIAKEPEQKSSPYYNFYLTQIDQKGQLLWENTYGSLEGINRPEDMISTSDNHLLLVGTTTKKFAHPDLHKAIHVVKVDYTGKVIWEKNYPFKYGDGKVSNSSGNTVVEVSDGYIIGGRYSTIMGTGPAGAMLTKISFDGKKIWSRSVTDQKGVISDLINGKNPDHYHAIGYFPEAHLLSFGNTPADPGQTVNFTDSSLASNGITRNDKYIFISSNPVSRQDGSSTLSIYKILQESKELLMRETYPTPAPYNRRISFDISVLHDTNTIISTGYVEDHANSPGKTKAYVLNINPDLSIDWQFINHNASKPEEAVGAFALPDGGVGVIANARTPISNPCPDCNGNVVFDIISTSINSTIVLYRFDKDGKLRGM